MSDKGTLEFLCPGVNWFQVEPDTVERLRCPVCGAECTRQRNVYRQPSATTYMIAGWHDEFTCPHIGEEWHWEAQQYVIEMQRTVSQRLRRLIFQDLLDFLAANGIQYEQD